MPIEPLRSLTQWGLSQIWNNKGGALFPSQERYAVQRNGVYLPFGIIPQKMKTSPSGCIRLPSAEVFKMKHGQANKSAAMNPLSVRKGAEIQ